MDVNRKRYLREFIPAMLAYAVMVIISVWLLKHQIYPQMRILIALLPMVPAFACDVGCNPLRPRAR